MKIYDCRQGSEEWTHLRAGIPCSSEFDKVITPAGKPSRSAEPYLFALLAERMMQHPRVEVMSFWMRRGSQMEADAVAFYELQRDCETVPVGFITNDEGTIGTSPDRLVGSDGLLEVKAPKEETHVAYLLQAGSAYEAYKVQTQGQLWLAEREWNDLLSYHSAMPPAIIRIERDEAFIRLLDAALATFCLELERQTQIIEERGWLNGNAKRPRPMSEQDELLTALKDSLRDINFRKTPTQI